MSGDAPAEHRRFATGVDLRIADRVDDVDVKVDDSASPVVDAAAEVESSPAVAAASREPAWEPVSKSARLGLVGASFALPWTPSAASARTRAVPGTCDP